MTPSTSKPETITLTRALLEWILWNMGWDDDDADVFWDLAKRKQEENGIQISDVSIGL